MLGPPTWTNYDVGVTWRYGQEDGNYYIIQDMGSKKWGLKSPVSGYNDGLMTFS